MAVDRTTRRRSVRGHCSFAHGGPHTSPAASRKAQGAQQKPPQEPLTRQLSWTASLAPQQRGGEGHPGTRSLKMGGGLQVNLAFFLM